MLILLGFSGTAANEIYQRQGIDSIDEWENFYKEDVVYLIFSFRETGGGRDGEMVGF